MTKSTKLKAASLVTAIAVVTLAAAPPAEAQAEPGSSRSDTGVGTARVELSEEHAEAVNRPRRIVDLGGLIEPWAVGPERWIDWRFSLLDAPGGTQIDSLWWCVDEGNVAYYPSEVLPVEAIPELKAWRDAGADLLDVMVAETHKRGLEAFFAYRLNGFDRGFDDVPHEQPVKREHPDWLIQGEGAWSPGGLWNFAVPGVHDYKVRILREVAENYDFEGMLVDFARHPPCLPVGHQWEHRDAMTAFVRKVRLMLEEVAAERGRPYLLAVRVPATVPGCHYDGMDIEAWARQNLVDIIVMGCRSIEVDMAGFRRAVAGTPIKLYPSLDDAHSPDGYHFPPIEFFRGLCANWWHQGADGIVAFNLYGGTLDASKAFGHHEGGNPAVHQQVFREVGDPEALRFKDKMFVVPRRYGAGWEDRWNCYHNANSEAPLPEILSDPDRPVSLSVYLADDLPGVSARVKSVELRLLLSGATAGDVAELKLNGILLPSPAVKDDGWRVFEPTPRQFAVGPNLVRIRLKERPWGSRTPVAVEKLEVHVAYN
ncbi:MAG: family 10 glycosylhydrolase [Candidatus Hydrogenedentes bacterium]|nr:family 10 glycosylhydrolase [Candidatus Hydrogenedentota bacterium]